MKFSAFFRGLGLSVVIMGSMGLRAAWPQTMGIDLDESSDRSGSGSNDGPMGLDQYGQSGRFGGASAGDDFRDMTSNQTPYIGDYPLDETQYKVGPGDLFQIVVEGASFEKQVNPEGNLILNRIGVVRLKGLTLKDAKKLLLDNLETAYKRRNCFVNLARPKTMRIFVTGAVNFPGTYDIAGNARMTDIIRRAGGFSSMAQKGTIEVRENGNSRTINTSAFMMSGDLDSNPYVNAGSILFVPFLDYDKPWVKVRGDSGSFLVQMEPGETLASLVLKAYPSRSPPSYLALLVQEKNGKESVLSAGEAVHYQPRSEANIDIFSSRQDVFVGGAVTTPGRQTYRPDQKVVEYISRAGIMTSSRVPAKVTIVRSNGLRESLSLQDSGLRPGDVILVGQTVEQKFLLYTPILLSVVSLALVFVQINSL